LPLMLTKKLLLFAMVLFVGSCDKQNLVPQFVIPNLKIVYLESSEVSFEQHLISKFSGAISANLSFIKAESYQELSNLLKTKSADIGIGRFPQAKESDVLQSEPYEDFNSPYVVLFSPYQESLRTEFHKWLHLSFRNGSLMSARELFVKPIKNLTPLDKTWLKKRYDRFKGFKNKVKVFARKYQVPWKLVAAVSYQESQWNIDARSHTGVKGLMQITEDTADFLGIDDRTHPLQSLYGGTKYLKYLISQQPKHLAERERIALALAAYNMGLGALRQTQKLAKQNGLNPYDWFQIRKFIPNPKGKETIAYVSRVLAYWDFIKIGNI
jgi:hypothetical protein